MAEYEASRSMPATAEVVFDVAGDVEHMGRWLPATIEVTPTDTGVHVEGEAGGRRYSAEGLFRSRPEQLRLEWGSESDAYAGWLQVSDAAAGASEVTLHLSFLGDQPQTRGEGGEDVKRGIEEALDRLADLVGQRVDATE